MFSDSIDITDVIRGVEAFNSRYAEMERVLWYLSTLSREELLKKQRSRVIEELIWTIKSWWGIQGVTKRIRSIGLEALLSVKWDTGLFAADASDLVKGEQFAVQRVSELVESMKRYGATRNEWSLASKILHWLMPWRVPVYDSFVKKSLGISPDRHPREGYAEIVRQEFDAARRLMAEDVNWLGDVEPRSPFRALDKYLWWLGGGGNDSAVVASDPWRVVRELGLKGR